MVCQVNLCVLWCVRVYVCVRANYFFYSPPVSNKALGQGDYDPPIFPEAWPSTPFTDLPIITATKPENDVSGSRMCLSVAY